MAVIKINESALFAAGFDRSFVDAMRHIVRQAGSVVGATTLPEVAAGTDTLTPIVDGLVITITATNLALSDQEVEQSNIPLSDHALTRRMDDMQADFERGSIERAGLLRTIDDLQADAAAHNTNLSALIRRVETLENGVL